MKRYPVHHVVHFRLGKLVEERNGFRYEIYGEESSCSGWRRGSLREVRKRLQHQVELLNGRHQFSQRPNTTHRNLARANSTPVNVPHFFEAKGDL